MSSTTTTTYAPRRSKEVILKEKICLEIRKIAREQKKLIKNQKAIKKKITSFDKKYKKFVQKGPSYIVRRSKIIMQEKENLKKLELFIQEKKKIVQQRAADYAVAKKFRQGALVICTDKSCVSTYNRVGKAIAIVDRTVPISWMIERRVSESMTLFKMNYNGKLFVIPSKDLRPATKEEKCKDPRNLNYWKDIGKNINLTNICYQIKAEPY